MMLMLSNPFTLPIVRGEPNSNPTNSNPYPSNGATDISLVPPLLSITVNDIDYIPAINEDKAVDGYSGTYEDWTEYGVDPYLNASDNSNYIFQNTTDLSKEGWFTFADTNNTGSGYSVTMYVEYDSNGDENCSWNIDTNGDDIAEISGHIPNGGSAGLKNTGVISNLDTVAEINDARVYFESENAFFSYDLQIDYVYLNIAHAKIYDDITVTFRTNESGIWKDAYTTSSIGNGTYYCLNTSWIDSYSTTYWWSVNTSDGYGGWDNDTYYFTTGANNPPNTPSSSSPANHTTSVSTTADLSWTGGDPDIGDTTRYCVYYGTSSNPPMVSNNQTLTTYDPGTMNYYTKYYWKIVAWDNHSLSTEGPIWDFTTTTKPYIPPVNPPNDDGDGLNNDSVIIDQKPTAIISGTYSGIPYEEIQFDATESHDNDEEGQTIVRFDWKFSDHQEWQQNLSATPTHNYTQPGLYKVTLKVIDDEGNSSINTTTVTIIKPNYPPTANFSHLPLKSTTDDVIQFTDLSSDADGTIVSYYWNFSDGTNSTEKNPYHKYNESGLYIITLKVTDDVGATNTSSHIILVEESQSQKTDKETPGFELIILLCAIAISIISLKKKRNT